MPRPPRRYYIVFTHLPTGATVKTYAVGTTPCAAKNEAFNQLERLLQLDPTRPSNPGWQLTTQSDEGLVSFPTL